MMLQVLCIVGLAGLVLAAWIALLLLQIRERIEMLTQSLDGLTLEEVPAGDAVTSDRCETRR